MVAAPTRIVRIYGLLLSTAGDTAVPGAVPSFLSPLRGDEELLKVILPDGVLFLRPVQRSPHRLSHEQPHGLVILTKIKGRQESCNAQCSCVLLCVLSPIHEELTER